MKSEEYAGKECKVPVTIKANTVESIKFIPGKYNLSVFENAGFDVEDFGSGTILVRSAPLMRAILHLPEQ